MEKILLIKKLKPALITLNFSSMKRNLCFGPKKFLGDGLNLPPISKFLQSDGVTTFVKKLSL